LRRDIRRVVIIELGIEGYVGSQLRPGAGAATPDATRRHPTPPDAIPDATLDAAATPAATPTSHRTPTPPAAIPTPAATARLLSLFCRRRIVAGVVSHLIQHCSVISNVVPHLLLAVHVELESNT
jgi:hypothetical protein